jgi:hypothetical protein
MNYSQLFSAKKLRCEQVLFSRTNKKAAHADGFERLENSAGVWLRRRFLRLCFHLRHFLLPLEITCPAFSFNNFVVL